MKTKLLSSLLIISILLSCLFPLTAFGESGNLNGGPHYKNLILLPVNGSSLPSGAVNWNCSGTVFNDPAQNLASINPYWFFISGVKLSLYSIPSQNAAENEQQLHSVLLNNPYDREKTVSFSNTGIVPLSPGWYRLVLTVDYTAFSKDVFTLATSTFYVYDSSAPAPQNTVQVLVRYQDVTGKLLGSDTVACTAEKQIFTPNRTFEGYRLLGPYSIEITPDPSRQNEITFIYITDAGSSPAPQITAVPTFPANGEQVVFGAYEQDNNLSNGPEPVVWNVLESDQHNGRVLLIADKVLDMQRFNGKWIEIPWSRCHLRSWLNSSFLYNCFTETERRYILQTPVSSLYVDEYDSSYDYVFLLSAGEARAYYPTKKSRIALPTAYAKAQDIALFDDGNVYWWLRDSTSRKSDANCIKPQGQVMEYGMNTNGYGVGVRPVIWLDMDWFYQ